MPVHDLESTQWVRSRHDVCPLWVGRLDDPGMDERAAVFQKSPAVLQVRGYGKSPGENEFNILKRLLARYLCAGYRFQAARVCRWRAYAVNNGTPK